jgi:hypothetical protein
VAAVAGIVVGHGGTTGLIVELSAAIGLLALGLAAWLAARKERN